MKTAAKAANEVREGVAKEQVLAYGADKEATRVVALRPHRRHYSLLFRRILLRRRLQSISRIARSLS